MTCTDYCSNEFGYFLFTVVLFSVGQGAWIVGEFPIQGFRHHEVVVPAGIFEACGEGLWNEGAQCLHTVCNQRMVAV